MSQTDYQNILPSPTYGVDSGGFISTTPGDFGQPFASYKLSLKQPVQEDRTISGKLINRTNSYGTWQITIQYNPMTKEDFEPVYRFLMHRRGRLKPFFVELPNYTGPKDPAFGNTLLTQDAVLESFPYTAGATSISISLGTEWTTNDYSKGLPTPGDLFTVRDTYDALHSKVYMVTKVETSIDYLINSWPGDSKAIIHFTPGLQRGLQGAMNLDFLNPKFQVVQTQDVLEYSLNTEDLYSFSVRLEEALY